MLSIVVFILSIMSVSIFVKQYIYKISVVSYCLHTRRNILTYIT